MLVYRRCQPDLFNKPGSGLLFLTFLPIKESLSCVVAKQTEKYLLIHSFCFAFVYILQTSLEDSQNRSSIVVYGNAMPKVNAANGT